MISFPPDWHSPRSECPHNENPETACTCKRKQNRKAYRVCRVNDRHAPHSVSPEIVMEIHQNGILVFREKGKRTSYETTAGTVFAGLVWKDAMKKAQAKKKKGRK